ncbi:MAG: ribonuclease D [Holosporaceae bacterium]|jgi:ribonuclease D|nr:ribonuclease D [Holosporaceae bacterium]
MWIDSEESVNAFWKRLREELAEVAEEDRFIAVDTEFIREKLETPLLCLVQLATSAASYIIDALSLDISFLKEIFEDTALLKVFHSPRQDFEMLCARGIETNNFYDTQLHEKLLGVDEKIGYRHLVKKYLDRDLDKDYCQSDWRKRPLSEKQLLYSAEDVVYLREVFKKQWQLLKKMNRHDWLLQEQEYYCCPPKAQQSGDGNSRNCNSEVFNQLCNWRSDHSASNRLIPNSLLEEICRKGTFFVRSLKNSRRTTQPQLQKFLEFAEEITKDINLPSHIRRKSVATYFLVAILEAKSMEHQIAPSLLATREDLENLVNGSRNVRCLQGWRREIFGSYAESFLRGNLAITMQDSQLVLK